MKKILVATDLSARSDRAIERAMVLGSALGAALRIVHVVDADIPEDMAERQQTDAETKLKAFMASFDIGPEVQVELAAVIGDPVEELLRQATQCGADVLALGAHRERKYLDAFRETTVERLIRVSPVPVLLVTARAQGEYKSVVAGVDLSPACVAAIKAARLLAPNATLGAFHAFQPPFQGFMDPQTALPDLSSFKADAEAALAHWVAETAIAREMAPVQLIEGDPHEAVAEMIAQASPDLLAMGAHARSPMNRWLVGRFTAGLVRRPPCDLLIAR